jgi:hypothetical protein
MNIFRSEEHLERWLSARERGGVMTSGKLSELAHAWYSDRLDPDWRARTLEQNQAILDSLGLTEEFWQLA